MRSLAGIMAGAVVALSMSCHATATLESISLPPVQKAPWRFTKFPILAWWGPPGSATLQDFENYRDAGFTIYPLNPDAGFYRALDKATSAGLAIMPFRKKQGFGVGKTEVTYPEDHPNVVGWITYDEPKDFAEAERSITEMNRLMREDPTRWAMFNALPPHVKFISTKKLIKAAVRNGMPVISYDNYVIYENGATDETQHFAALDLYWKLSLKYDVPFWAFALTIKHAHYRRPSESDVRWKQFTNLAYGAKGLWYFTYWGPTDWDEWDNRAIIDPATGEKTELYGYVKAVNDNVQSMGQVLLKLTSVDVMHTSPTASQPAFKPGSHWIADVHARKAIVGFFRHEDGTRYAMIVNGIHGKGKSAGETSDTITLKFAPGVRGVEAVAWLDGTTGPLKLKDGMTTITVAGGTGVLLKKL